MKKENNEEKVIIDAPNDAKTVDDEKMKKVIGGANPFAGKPRVGTNDIDEGVKDNI